MYLLETRVKIVFILKFALINAINNSPQLHEPAVVVEVDYF